MTDRPEDQVPPAARWGATGPDPDAPPWSREQKGEGEPMAGEPTPDPQGTGQPAGGGADAEPDEAVPGVDEGGDEAEEDGPGSALAEIVGEIPNVPAPPRRTGVFLDAEDLREHVGALLRAFLGGYQVDAWGNYTFAHEGARVFVTVGQSPIGPQVGVFSVTNLEIDLTPQLGGFLLTTNHKLGFGSFSYDPDNKAVWLRHSLLGTTLDGPELQSAVAAVASTAAHFDDIIRDRFGGRAFHDAPQDVQDRTKPPETSQEGHPNASGYL